MMSVCQFRLVGVARFAPEKRIRSPPATPLLNERRLLEREAHMAFYREATSQPFTVIANQSLQDPDLSFEATGLLAFMISLPADWQYSREWLIKQKKKIGRDKLKRLLKELEENGYLERKYKQNEKGRMVGHDWLVKPLKANELAPSTEGLKTRPTVKPAVGKTATTNKTVLQSKKSKSVTSKQAEFFSEKVMTELLADNLPSAKIRYARLKISEYEERFPESDSVADCWSYVVQAVEHQIKLTGS